MQTTIKFIYSTIINVLILPLIIVRDIFKSNRSVIRKIGYTILILIIFFNIWIRGYQDVYTFLYYQGYRLGLFDKLISIHVSGTSMLPTIQDGEDVNLNSPIKLGIVPGDIVSFHNAETGSFNYIKRVIAKEGDTVTLVNGNVLINDQVLKDDFTYQHEPTYGNTFIADCESYTVPQNSFLVLGDNRSVSQDSRVIGFINKDDIRGVIKTNIDLATIPFNQAKQTQKIVLNEQKLNKLINTKRKESNREQLVVNTTLSTIAKQRAEDIKNKWQDWKNTSFPIDQLLQKQAYKYNLVHEYVIYGYLNEEAIVNQIFESEVEKEAFLSPSYMELGIGSAEKTSNSCVFPISSIILSWPSVPTYDEADIQFWETEVSATKNMLNQLQTYGIKDMNDSQTQLIIQGIAEESEIANRILTKMKTGELLSEKDKIDANRYSDLVIKSKKSLGLSSTDSTSSNKTTTQSVNEQSISQTSNNIQTSSGKTFVSAGQLSIEKEVTAKINKVQESDNIITITITFANQSSSATTNVSPLRVQLHNDSQGEPPNESILQLALSPGQMRTMDLTYNKEIIAPYYWKYANSGGDMILLGSLK